MVSKAVDSSFKNTINMEDEFVRNSKKVSAARLRERCVDTEVIKLINVLRQERGNDLSNGKIDSYQQLSLR